MLATELKTGTIFKEDNYPFLVVKYEHTKTARGGATVKVKAKNLVTGQVLEKRYQAKNTVEEADVHRKNVQYLYHDNLYYFMDPETYEQFTIEEDILGDSTDFLQEGENVQVMFFEGKPVIVDLPLTMVFEIAETEPGFKGNTVSNVMKDAKLANGTVIKVPTHIKAGDKVKYNTQSREYVSKA